MVHSVNGMPIERETEAYAAFVALKDAAELRVDFSRGGERRELVYSIVARNGKAAAPAKTKSPAAPAPKDAPAPGAAPTTTPSAPAQDAG